MNLRLIILIVLVCCAKVSFSQTKEIDSLMLVLLTSKEDTSKVNTLNTLGWNLIMVVGNSKNALQHGEKALLLAEKLGYEKGKAYACQTIGYASLELSNFSDALKYIYAALKFFEVAGNRKEIANSLHAIGFSLFYLGNATDGFSRLFGALKIREEIGEKWTVAQSLNVIGFMYTEQGKYPEALQKHFAALKICIDTASFDGPAWGLPFTYENIGYVYEKQGDGENTKGDKLTAINKFNEAIKKYHSALQIWQELGREIDVAERYVFIGGIHIKLKNKEMAKYYLLKALPVILKFEEKENIKNAYLGLSIVDSIEGNYKQAYEHYKLYVFYKDIIINEEIIRKSEGYKMQYDFNKKEDSLNQKQAITQTKLDSQKNQKNFYLAGAGMLALLSLFVFLNFRNQKKINRLAGDAHAKEKAELELQSLRAQLNPHFMFNSLNAIQELILLEENEKSQSYLARFAKLLRLLLENADKPFIPLQRELDFLQLYLSLEKLRIPDLQFSINVDAAINTEETKIPNMILQPYIENSIWHGLSHKEKDKKLTIRISNENGFTKYEVEDNGVGRKRSAELKSLYQKEHRSKGMELLSKRFKLLAKEYGSEVETTITDVLTGKENGTIVTIKVPNNIKLNQAS